MNGMGIFTWDESKQYYGEYLNGKKDGYGIMETLNGSYIGMWKSGKQHGLGILMKKDEKLKLDSNDNYYLNQYSLWENGQRTKKLDS